MGIKNPGDLFDIPKEKLFISESGYAYSIDMIADFINSDDWDFNEHKNREELQGTFRDFKNKERESEEIKEALPIHLFTERDIAELLKHREIVSAYEKSPLASGLKDLADGISETTLELIGEVAKKSQILESGGESANEARLGLVLSTPLHALSEHLKTIKKTEKNALIYLTSQGGPVGRYSEPDARGMNFIDDLNKIYNSGCGAGFNRHIANVFTILKSYKLYQQAKKQLQMESSHSFSANKAVSMWAVSPSLIDPVKMDDALHYIRDKRGALGIAELDQLEDNFLMKKIELINGNSKECYLIIMDLNLDKETGVKKILIPIEKILEFADKHTHSPGMAT
ncbi:hypothetical protein [Legionella sp. 29fVS95]|uniref:hypothetical protein n=1 Tax=Legionella sp. 29fVS95 TaxID=3402813 RepID=UPI003AF7F46B